MARQSRRNRSPDFKAKVALVAQRWAEQTRLGDGIFGPIYNSAKNE